MRLRRPPPAPVALVASAWGLACVVGCSGGGTHARPDAGVPTQGPSVCVDTMFDPHNCGACGHDCGGGACQNGECAPLGSGVLATGQGQPGALVVDDTNAYWANANPPAIVACAKAGCGNSPTVLAQGTWGAASNLVLVGKDLYWGGSNAAIYRCSTAGCGGNPDVISAAGAVHEVAVDTSGSIYFIESFGPTTMSPDVAECPMGDCDGGVLIPWVPDGGMGFQLAGPNATPRALALAIDLSNLYILGSEPPFTFLVECSLGACASTVLLEAATVGGAPTPYLAVDSTSFYVVQGGGNANPVGAGNASVSVVLRPDAGTSSPGQPVGALNGGSTTLIGDLSAPSALVLDAQAIYVADWGETDDSGTRASGAGRIVKCPLSGCGGVGETFQDYINEPAGLANDATNLYWTELSATGDALGLPSGRVAFRAK